MIVPAKSWEYLESVFKDSPEMTSLVQHIKSSELSHHLYALSSLDKLVISIYDQIEMHREALHVKFDKRSEKWNFTYYAIPFRDPEFVRTYERSDGINKFNAFIKLINW